MATQSILVCSLRRVYPSTLKRKLSVMDSATIETNPAPIGGSGAMFDNIADRYDLLNRIISLGIDQSWRRKTVASLALDPSSRVLDLATGTADLAIMIAKLHPGVEITGVDPSNNMLAVGQKKVERELLTERVRLLEGDAQALPFEDNSFDGTCIAFGIRNVPDRVQGLRERSEERRVGKECDSGGRGG